MQLSNSVKLANIQMLEFIAEKLGPICESVVFLGGCTTSLFITDELSPDARYTMDVDCIVDVLSLSQYYKMEKNLIKQGFKKSLQEEVLCRWQYGSVILDVMPTDESILGFGNRWYKPAIRSAINYLLPNETPIKLVSALYFLATKLEAFYSRGKSDYYASHDFEDIVSVLDGRNTIFDEIKHSEGDLKEYLKSSLHRMLQQRGFHDALPGHFIQYGNLAKARSDLLVSKIEEMNRD